jgi:tRNA (guanine-N7-)-methyltransferase
MNPISMKISLTRNIPCPNIYVKMLPEYEGWIYLEEKALEMKGLWAKTFPNPERPLDLEIGCGNGFFFHQQAKRTPLRNLLGIEIKYKPLVQTVRRVKTEELPNGRGIRFNARQVDLIFSPGELDNVFIYFPDPWPKKRHQKNRLMRREFFQKLHGLQKPGTFVDIKTDSLDYFEFAFEEAKNSPYILERVSRDLHKSEWAKENFVTSFEKIFISKGQPIHYMRLAHP